MYPSFACREHSILMMGCLYNCDELNRIEYLTCLILFSRTFRLIGCALRSTPVCILQSDQAGTLPCLEALVGTLVLHQRRHQRSYTSVAISPLLHTNH